MSLIITPGLYMLSDIIIGPVTDPDQVLFSYGFGAERFSKKFQQKLSHSMIGFETVRGSASPDPPPLHVYNLKLIW